jgi:Carboxypeptidase regulatory-like domain
MRMNNPVAIAFAILMVSGAEAQERPRLPQGPPGTVTLPVADYDALIDLAAQPGRPADGPPVPAVVTRADLRARVDGETARGTLRLDGETFERGHVKIALVSGATLLEARAEGRPLPVIHQGDVHAAVMSGPSPFSITLDWIVPLATSPGRAAFVLPLPAAGTIGATIDLPGDPADVRIEPGLITGRQTAAGRTTLDVTLEPGKRTQVSWSVRETTAAPASVETRLLADVKSLVTIGDADLRLLALVDVTVVRGEPRTFDVRLPAGFEVASVSGASLETSATRDDVVTLTVRDPVRRRHQFLISLEQTRAAGSFKADMAFPTVSAAEREAGEAAVEATGTVEVTASGDAALRRMDVRETDGSLRSLARQPLLAAFRYQRRPNEVRVMTIDVHRYADAPVIAAAAERAVATTLVTVEGRMLTEVQLTLRNRAQPFMKVALPPGATMLSVEVAGETAKPAMGSDGTRVPLLRAGFRPVGPYTVTFIYLHAGEAFAKKGDASMILPAIDVPVTVLEWELFLPDRFSTKPSGGNVIPAHLVGVVSPQVTSRSGSKDASGFGRAAGGALSPGILRPGQTISSGQIIGRITDQAGAVIPGASVTATGANGAQRTAISDGDGFYTIHDVPSGTVQVRAELPGFKRSEYSFTFDQRPRQLDLQLVVGGVSETVMVQGNAALVDTRSARAEEAEQQAPSQNVLNLQRRVAGVLPVRMDVPRTGTSHRFVRPLVLEEATNVTFRYKRR